MTVARHPLVVALLAALLSVVVPAAARAADPPTRLLVEIPEGSEQMKAGEQIAVQVVGESEAGARVGFPGRTVQITASVGKVEVVERPFKFRYVAPESVDGPIRVKLSAHLEEAPTIRGAAHVRVVPARTDDPDAALRSLIVRGDTTQVPLGGSTVVDVLGDTGSGAARPVLRRKVTLVALGKADPAGTVEHLGEGRFRYTAPGRGGAFAAGDTVKLVAALAENGNVTGSLEVTLVRAERPETKPPVTPPVTPPNGVRPDRPGPERPKPEAPATPDDDEKDDDKGVLMSSKHVRVMVWRTKDTAAETFTNDRKFPKDAETFVAMAPFQKFRFVIERDDVLDVQLAWYVGNKTGATVHVEKPVEGGKVGPLRVNRNKQGNLAVHVELTTPDNGKPLRAELRLALKNGRTLLQPFTLRRGSDKDRDGQPDGQK